jgi:hypothetical protein
VFGILRNRVQSVLTTALHVYIRLCRIMSQHLSHSPSLIAWSESQPLSIPPSSLSKCSSTFGSLDILTHSFISYVSISFAEHRAFEHTEQSLTYCLGQHADYLKA